MSLTVAGLRSLSQERFPDQEESAILKVVGNLIYYRYMNPAVVYVFVLSGAWLQRLAADNGRAFAARSRWRRAATGRRKGSM